MEGTFDSARLMLSETLEYITAFEEIAKPFVAQSNWSAVIEVDRQTREQVGKIQFKTDLSPRLAARTYDVFRYLRDALDHSLFASAFMIRGSEPSRFKYPFGDTPVAVEAEIMQGRCDDLHPDILKIVIASRPYEAGNRPLWAMNKLRNRSTHRVLSPANAQSGGFGITSMTAGDPGFTMTPMSEWKSTRRQLAFLRVSSMAPDDHLKITPTVTVALNPAFGFGDRPAVDVFRETYAMVSKLVADVETETMRIIAER